MGNDGKKGDSMVHIGTVLPGVVGACRGPSDSDLTRVWTIWNGAVGESVAANAQPWAFKGTLLLVHVSSSTWFHHLGFMKAEIIDKVNQALGRKMIGDIKFKIGTVNTRMEG